MIDVIQVHLWGERVGVLYFAENTLAGEFQYDPDFINSGLQISPIKMPLSETAIYQFPDHARTKSFAGLPGVIADSLPEKFGNAVLGKYLAKQGRSFDELTPAERLAYIGTRGMGALEYQPDHGSASADLSIPIEVDELMEVAKQVLGDRKGLKADFSDEGMEALIQVGTSAGGAKAKAVIALNEETGEVRSGQAEAPDGFTHWLLKFDEVDNEELATSKQIGRIEYAYHLMALEADIAMMPCRLLDDGQSAHFMTRRFDRGANGEKYHTLSFCGMAHADRDPPGMVGYESLFNTMRQLRLGQDDLEQMYRRLVFNIVCRNHDDHTKNHAFLMDGDGDWSLSPAYDLCFSYKKGNPFIETHQMSTNGKRDNFTMNDLLAVGKAADVGHPGRIIEQVQDSASQWAKLADEAGIETAATNAIGKLFRNF